MTGHVAWIGTESGRTVTLTRRNLLQRTLWLVPGAMLTLLAACGESSPNGSRESDLSTCSSGGDCDTSGVVDIALSGSHSHDVPLTQEDLDQAQDVTLTLGETQGHTHTLELSSDALADIDDGLLLRLESSEEAGHSHCVSFNCGTSGGGGGGYGY